MRILNEGGSKMDKKEIEAKVLDFINSKVCEFEKYDKVESDIENLGPGELGMEWRGEKLCVKVANMYEFIDITFDNVKEFVRAIGATECDFRHADDEIELGCETCDYGSRYPTYLTVWGWK